MQEVCDIKCPGNKKRKEKITFPLAKEKSYFTECNRENKVVKSEKRDISETFDRRFCP